MRHHVRRPGPIVFDHLPKCGGTSLQHGLLSCYPDSRVFQIDGSNPIAIESSVERFKAMNSGDAWRFKLVLGHMASKLLLDIRPDAHVVTVLRHPVARVLSLYRHVCRRPEHYLHHQVWARDIGPAGFVELAFDFEYGDIIPELANEPRNWYATHFTGWTLREVERRPQAAVDQAVTNIRAWYDIVGTMEGYGDLVRVLNQRVGLGLKQLRHKNADRSTAPLVTDPAQVDTIIADTNAIDIEIYDRVVKDLAIG